MGAGVGLIVGTARMMYRGEPPAPTARSSSPCSSSRVTKVDACRFGFTHGGVVMLRADTPNGANNRDRTWMRPLVNAAWYRAAGSTPYTLSLTDSFPEDVP